MSDLTKRALRDSLFRLLERKPFDKITVRDITDECQVSRMTFYYHFNDIYDLLDWSGKAQATWLMGYIEEGHTWEEALGLMLTKYEQNSSAIINICQSRAASLFRGSVGWQIDKLLYNDIAARFDAESGETSEKEMRFVANFYQYAILGVVFEWISGGMETPGRDLICKVKGVTDCSLDAVVKGLTAGEH